MGQSDESYPESLCLGVRTTQIWLTLSEDGEAGQSGVSGQSGKHRIQPCLMRSKSHPYEKQISSSEPLTMLIQG